MSLQIATLLGFATERDGRYWNDGATLGLRVNEDNTVTLLDSEGCPSNHELGLDHAQHILARARQSDDDADATVRRWDNYASSL